MRLGGSWSSSGGSALIPSCFPVCSLFSPSLCPPVPGPTLHFCRMHASTRTLTSLAVTRASPLRSLRVSPPASSLASLDWGRIISSSVLATDCAGEPKVRTSSNRRSRRFTVAQSLYCSREHAAGSDSQSRPARRSAFPLRLPTDLKSPLALDLSLDSSGARCTGSSASGSVGLALWRRSAR